MFQSLASHLKKPLQFKDDFESLGYVILYSIIGTVWWFGKKNNISVFKAAFLQDCSSKNRTIKLIQEYIINTDRE